MDENGTDLWFEEPKKEVSLKDINEKITKLREADTYAKARKTEADLATAEVSHLKTEVIQMLAESGLKSYKLPGVGSVSIVEKLSVKTPKTHEDKEKFFEWLKTQGDDMYFQYASVNSNSLNSLFKMKQEEYAERGEVLDIPGLEEPSSYTTLSLKK